MNSINTLIWKFQESISQELPGHQPRMYDDGNLAAYHRSLLAQGYDAETAAEMTDALLDGDGDLLPDDDYTPLPDLTTPGWYW